MILQADHELSEIRQDSLDSLEMAEDWVTTARTAGYTSTLAPHSSHWSHTATHSTLSSSASSWSSQWRVSQCGLSWFTLPVLHTPPQPDHNVFPVSQPGITKTLHTPPSASSWQVNDPVARHHLNIILTIISYKYEHRSYCGSYYYKILKHHHWYHPLDILHDLDATVRVKWLIVF